MKGGINTYWLTSASLKCMRQLGAVTGEEERVVDFIVKAFASLAKSNSVLMGLKISDNDRANMDDIIRQTRIRYQ
jgi:hypothetical protein